MIVGTAGHIDHGKTSLVRALTAVDCDRLKEEKARGITIELGFAYWPRPAGTIGFVDVPGHEKLVHAMLAGATGIDFVLLVIAADDGPMPQTREHLAILDLLGLERGLVVLTKCDLVDAERRAAVEAEVAVLLEGTSLEGTDVIGVSSVTGEGIERLGAALDAALADTRSRAADGRFRLGIDRVFSLKGTGTVVTGTVMSGTIRAGDAVTVSPGNIAARVRSLHAQNAPAETAKAGDRCALALTGPNVSTETIGRGEVVLDPALHAPTRRIDVSLRLLATERRTLGQWTAIRIHHAATEITGRLVVLSADAIAPGTDGLAQVVLDAPLAAAVGDRFVLRDVSATRTMGGGVILDIAAPERKRKAPDRLAELALLRDAPALAALEGILGGPRRWVDIGAFMRDRAASAEAAAAAVVALDLVVIEAGPVAAAFLPSGWRRFVADVGEQLDALHRDSPELTGIGAERLRLSLTPRLPAPVFAAALARLAAAGEVTVDRSWVRRPWHEVRLSHEEEALWAVVAPLIGGTERFRPPRVRDIAKSLEIDEARLRRLFRLVARRGDVEEVARDHFFLSGTVAEMADTARRLAEEAAEPGFSVIAFRDALDNGRKVAIQILEFFDRQGLTMRRGDHRRINPHKRSLFAHTPPADAALGATSFGGESSPVGRPDFKSGWGRETVPGGFDSCLLRQNSEVH